MSTFMSQNTMKPFFKLVIHWRFYNEIGCSCSNMPRFLMFPFKLCYPFFSSRRGLLQIFIVLFCVFNDAFFALFISIAWQNCQVCNKIIPIHKIGSIHKIWITFSLLKIIGWFHIKKIHIMLVYAGPLKNTSRALNNGVHIQNYLGR